jgi:glutamate/tyrosine decarboxylase-like PLP-dependent enzyme
VVLGEQAHASVFKALSLLGLGRQQLEIIPADDQGAMDTGAVPELDERTLLILQAGNVHTGAFDPIEQLCKKARHTGAWVHIDGAFGLWCEISPTLRHLTRGMGAANSWSVDGHKTLNTPYDCGIILCRDKEALTSAMQAGGSYIQYSDQRDPMDFVPEMSRQARAVGLWATMKTLGREGMEELVIRLHRLALRFADRLSDEGFTIHNQVVFNQILVACITPAQTEATLQQIQKDGTCWCGSARWRGEPVIRISICSWRTTEADIDRSVVAFVAAKEQTTTSGI